MGFKFAKPNGCNNVTCEFCFSESPRRNSTKRPRQPGDYPIVAPLLVDTEELMVDRGDSREQSTPSPTNFFRPQKGKMPMIPVFTTPGGSRKASDPIVVVVDSTTMCTK